MIFGFGLPFAAHALLTAYDIHEATASGRNIPKPMYPTTHSSHVSIIHKNKAISALIVKYAARPAIIDPPYANAHLLKQDCK